MATKPSTLPEWATDGGADVVEPLIAQKQLGWVLSQKPPAQWFNWWQLLVYQWVVWLDAFEDEAHTWAAAQIFSDDVTIGGDLEANGDATFSTGAVRFNAGMAIADSIVGDTADTTPLIKTNAGPTAEPRKLLTQYGTDSGIVRVYITNDPVQHELTYNALYNDGSGDWDVDDITSPSRRVTLCATFTMKLERYTSGGVSFAEGSWVTEFETYHAGAGATPGVLDDNGLGIITRAEYKRYSSSGFGTALPLEANVDVVVTPDYTRNFLGETIVTGYVSSNTTIASGTKIAQLPVGYRPYRTRQFPIIAFKNDAVWLEVDTAGQIKLMNDGSYTVTALFGIHLDLIRFDANF